MGAITDPAPPFFSGAETSQIDYDRIEQLWGRDVVDNPAIGYSHLITTSCFLPRMDPGDIGMWKRKDGNLIMTMTRGPAMNPRTRDVVLMGYPFGIWPRRFHSILNAEILRNRSREIYCPEGFCGFFSERLGGSRGTKALLTGGTTGNIGQMKNQFARLIAANLVFGLVDETKMSMIYPARLIETMELWFAGEEEYWPGVLRASPQYVDSLIEHAVPIDLKASACIRSSLEYDIYTWVTRRNHSLHVRNEQSVKIPWAALHFQFGKSFKSLGHFKAEFKAGVAHIRGFVYPDLNFREYAGGWILRKCPLAVPTRYWGFNVVPKQRNLFSAND